MKTIITTIVLGVLMVTATNAQIKKPKIPVNQTKISNVKALPALKINDLNKLNSLDDIKKIDAPTSEVTTEQENASSSQTRIINVNKLKDGDLKLVSIRGSISTAPSLIYIHTNDSDEDSGVNAGSTNTINKGVFPLKLAFRMLAGAEYRLKIISSKTPFTNYIYVATKFQGQQNFNIARIDLNSREEYNYIIQEENTGNMELFFTAIPNPPGQYHDWMDLTIKEIRIDRIN